MIQYYTHVFKPFNNSCIVLVHATKVSSRFGRFSRGGTYQRFPGECSGDRPLDPAQALEDIRTCQDHDRELRASAIEDNIIVNPNCPPRRIWDLWSNRVVPLWVTTPFQGERSKTWFAVSHSWMSEDLRHTVETPINGFEWPVPIPTETTLERVRVELLNYASKLNVNLVWLDVLCLRQAGAQANEGLRIAEWRLDVPTIGEVYPEAYRTVYYYSGLGLPFEAKEFDSPRHWQNRAWTLQETNPSRIVGGCSPLSPSMPGVGTRNLPVGEAIRPMYDKINVWESFSHVADSIFTVLEAMRHRSATNELDKVAGLNYYLAKFSPLPAYVVGDDPENAWNRIVKATHPMQRADLFFLFPEPGNGKHVWCPSWQQIKDAESLPKRRTLRKYVNLDEDCDSYSFSGYCLERCWLEGLSVIGDPGSVREGRISLVSTRGIIPVAANHSIILEDGYYTLIGGDWIDQWVLVRRTESGLYCKLSVIQIRGGDGSIRKMCSKGKGNTEMRLL
ncbi:hypothetical protein SCHPADRAFT_836408 [Schizopora paradoxa]|uniref:Heterokaryon incompatibility domain-containing protein n=1 Tax=Schizopora paradoxa TaxID=27342 RepID=A0A0H2RS31_9AGAM|nr:hypothetical protein SCHPADRAFT_836408 [Schizopora paradoxa]